MGRAVSFEDFARDVKERVPQATQLVNRTCFRLGSSWWLRWRNIAMPGHVMIAGESAFWPSSAPDSLRDGISLLPSQPDPAGQVHDYEPRLAAWAKAAASRVIVKHIR